MSWVRTASPSTTKDASVKKYRGSVRRHTQYCQKSRGDRIVAREGEEEDIASATLGASLLVINGRHAGAGRCWRPPVSVVVSNVLG